MTAKKNGGRDIFEDFKRLDVKMRNLFHVFSIDFIKRFDIQVLVYQGRIGRSISSSQGAKQIKPTK